MSLFKCDDMMPDCERPYAVPKPSGDSPFMSPLPDYGPDTMRPMMTPADLRVANGNPLRPNPMQQVHNLSPAKRGRHY